MSPKRSCRYFAAFRVRIGCTFRMASLCASVFSATDYGGVTKNSGAMLVLAWDKEKKNLMVVPKLILPELWLTDLKPVSSLTSGPQYCA